MFSSAFFIFETNQNLNAMFLKTNFRPAVFSLIAVLLIIAACSTVPLIGRKQVLLLPESELVSMGTANYRGFLDTSRVVNTGNEAREIKEIGSNISVAVEKYLKEQGLENRLKDFKWEFSLIESDVPNAWCMPGGKVCFYTGILPYTQNKNGIAVVMGHEIAHAVARHGNERMSQQLMAVAGGAVLSEFIKEKPEVTQNIFMSVFSVGASVGLLLPYSRLHEYEADRLGLIFMAMAGYDPNEAVKFWERMSKMGGARPPEFLSTHPADEKRIENMKKVLPEALNYYKP